MKRRIYLGIAIAVLIAGASCKTLSGGMGVPAAPAFTGSAELRGIVVGQQVGDVLDLFGVKTKRVTFEDEPPGVARMVSFSHNGGRVYLRIRPALNLWPGYISQNWEVQQLRETVVEDAMVSSRDGYLLE